MQPGQDVPSLLQVAGHDEVPHQHAALRQAVVVEHEVADLAVHLRDHGPRHGRVVSCLAQPGARILSPELIN